MAAEETESVGKEILNFSLRGKFIYGNVANVEKAVLEIQDFRTSCINRLEVYIYESQEGVYYSLKFFGLQILQRIYTKVSIRWPNTRDRQFFPADGTPHQQKEVL
ncbi:MAG: hypothetical protein WCS96_03510 [Victivallales bacterium]|jgi:hypothetical protein